MGDVDLEEIRRARLQQLQQSQNATGAAQTASQGNDQQATNAERETDARRTMLAQILTPDAADRLNRIRLVKETRATDVEDRLIMAARQGGLRGRVGETELKSLLGKLSEMESARAGAGKTEGIDGEGEVGGMRVVRRKGWEDDDDLEGLDDFK